LLELLKPEYWMGSTCSMHGLMSNAHNILVEILQQRVPCEKPKHR